MTDNTVPLSKDVGRRLTHYLERYKLDLQTGFLLRDALTTLPPYFDAWRRLASDMPRLVKEKKMVDAVHELEELDSSSLDGFRELSLAHLQLSLITSGYVWQNGDAGVPKCLPRNLAVPLSQVSQRLGLQPVLTHATLVLANVTLIDPKGPWDPDNMRCLYHMPEETESDWFIIITGHTEVVFAKCFEPMFQILDTLLLVFNSRALKHGLDIGQAAEVVSRAVDAITVVIGEIKESFVRMHERLTPTTFFNAIRPFLAGWGGKKNPLKHVLIYEGVSNQPLQYPGGSGAQSTSLQMLDSLLGVNYTTDGRKFMIGMRECMLPEHRVAVEDIEDWPLQLRDFVLLSKSPQLHQSYNRCVGALEDLRTYHIQVVTKYIVLPASKRNSGRFVSLDKRGTAGTSLIPFLKLIRDDTRATQLSSLTLVDQAFDFLRKSGKSVLPLAIATATTLALGWALSRWHR